MPYRGKDELSAGMIIMWSGLLSNVPAGWSVCDGTNGTPDLRDKFVRGASGEVGETGGCSSHDHTLSGLTGCESAYSYVMVDSGSGHMVPYFGHKHTLDNSSNDSSHTPPYYELIFIRKD